MKNKTRREFDEESAEELKDPMLLEALGKILEGYPEIMAKAAEAKANRNNQEENEQ